MRVRRRMLWNGVVTVSVVLSQLGKLCAVPSISQSGLADCDMLVILLLPRPFLLKTLSKLLGKVGPT